MINGFEFYAKHRLKPAVHRKVHKQFTHPELKNVYETKQKRRSQYTFESFEIRF